MASAIFLFYWGRALGPGAVGGEGGSTCCEGKKSPARVDATLSFLS